MFLNVFFDKLMFKIKKIKKTLLLINFQLKNTFEKYHISYYQIH